MTMLFFATSSGFAQVDSTNVSTSLQGRVAPPPPPPPPLSNREFTECYNTVENMPRFTGCENIEGTDAEKKQCANRKMLEYVLKFYKLKINSLRFWR